jgi:hypothetical protein
MTVMLAMIMMVMIIIKLTIKVQVPHDAEELVVIRLAHK